MPSVKPTLPPIAKPAAARSRLVPMSFSRLPVVASLNAVLMTLLGAGSTCGDSHPSPEPALPQMTTRDATGASQESSLQAVAPDRQARFVRRAEESSVSAPEADQTQRFAAVCSALLQKVFLDRSVSLLRTQRTFEVTHGMRVNYRPISDAPLHQRTPRSHHGNFTRIRPNRNRSVFQLSFVPECSDFFVSQR